MKKVMLFLCICVLGCASIGAGFVGASAAETEELVSGCKAAYLCDFYTGTTAYAKNETAHLPIASMCKIMTLVLCFEELSNGLTLDEPITVSETASGMGGSQVFLEAGGVYPAGELIKSICIASANDSCVAMAERIAGGESAFVRRMNERAKELGMNDTIFVNCTGLPAAVTATMPPTAVMTGTAFIVVRAVGVHAHASRTVTGAVTAARAVARTVTRTAFITRRAFADAEIVGGEDRCVFRTHEYADHRAVLRFHADVPNEAVAARAVERSGERARFGELRLSGLERCGHVDLRGNLRRGSGFLRRRTRSRI